MTEHEDQDEPVTVPVEFDAFGDPTRQVRTDPEAFDHWDPRIWRT